MTFQITNPTPTNFQDPNGTQSEYHGAGSLSIGGTVVDIARGIVLFYHSSSGMTDVANFSLYPTSGDPTFYYPAPQLIPGSNAGALVEAPVYSPGTANSVFFLVPGGDPSVPADNAVYSVSSFSFTSIGVPVPSTLLLLPLGTVLGIVAFRRHGQG